MEQDEVSLFLYELLGGKEYREADATTSSIQHPAVLSQLFTQIVGALDETKQIRALDAIILLAKSSCGNIEICTSVGLQTNILAFLGDRALFTDPWITTNVLKKILRLLLVISNHSVSSADIRSMMSLFQRTRMKQEEPKEAAMGLYLSTLEMIARDAIGPTSFFDLNGHFSGLVIQSMDSFPNQGYTFCAWIKFECLPTQKAPLLQLCGKTGVGIVMSFIEASLIVTVIDKKGNDVQIEVPELVTEGKWHLFSVSHTHRQIRGSKLEVFLDGELKQSSKFVYPNVGTMVPLTNAFLGMTERQPTAPCLRVLLGPCSLFGQALPSNILQTMKYCEEYDALVLQFNSYISSSSSIISSSSSSSGSNNTGGSVDGLLFAFDARNCDRSRGLCYDSSGFNHHAEAASAGVRLRQVETFKQAVAQLGGPMICLPLLVTTPQGQYILSTSDVSGQNIANTSQFEEDTHFQMHMTGLISRPLGARCIPKVILLMAEIMRYSSVNKFTFRRHQGVRLTALLMRSLPSTYLTIELLTSMEKLRSAVASDRTLADEVYKFLLFNFRVWVNASLELQRTVFDKLEDTTRKNTSASSAVWTRHFLRCLSWIYWTIPNATSLRRTRDFSREEIEYLRGRILTIIKLTLCEPSTSKLSMVERAAAAATSSASGAGGSSSSSASQTSKEVKLRLSFESTRSLIFCMIGKPTNPMATGVIAESICGQNSQQQISVQQDQLPESTSGSNKGASSGSVYDSQSKNAGTTKKVSEGDADAGSVVENVPETDLPDLLKLLVEISIEKDAPAGLLDLFGRLGGLRIWLPLLSFSSDEIRVMTLSLLRRYLNLKCNIPISQDDRNLDPAASRKSLSVGDVQLIIEALNPKSQPVSMGVYTEMLLILLGIPVTEKDLEQKHFDIEAYIDDDSLKNASIWHTRMIYGFLELVRTSSLAIRILATRHMKILFGSLTTASGFNRCVLIYNYAATVDHLPACEAFLHLRNGIERENTTQDAITSPLYGVELQGCPDIPMSRLRDIIMTSTDDQQQINGIYAMVASGDHHAVEFLKNLMMVRNTDVNDTKTGFWDSASTRVKLALVRLFAYYQPSGSISFITSTCIELLSDVIVFEVQTSEVAWQLIQDPFTNLSNIAASKEEVEQLVGCLLKEIFRKLNLLLSDLITKNTTLTRDSILWKNVESICTVCSALVLHYDPDTLGMEDPSKDHHSLNSATQQQQNLFWKCERLISQEIELIDGILSIWQYFASLFHPDMDAGFGRTAAAAQTSLPLGSAAESQKDQQSGRLFGILPTVNTSAGVAYVSYAKPHPGGIMRQVLQLLMRGFYLVLLADKGASDNTTSSVVGVSLSSQFFGRINKLEYFLQAMNLGRDNVQFDASFVPASSRAASSAAVSSGLINSSGNVKASPGDETTLVLWLVPELAYVIDVVRHKHWSDSAARLAAVLSRLISVSIRSSEELIAFLANNDFFLNATEIRRRDGFYHEQLLSSRAYRATRRKDYDKEENEAKSKAHLELERICSSTRVGSRQHRNIQQLEQAEERNNQVWLDRVKAKDIEDWMKLRVVLKWGIRHIWGIPSIINNSPNDATEATDTDDESNKNFEDHWHIDPYTSSNWIRCRLLPDTDDTAASFDLQARKEAFGTHDGVLDDQNSGKGKNETELADSLSVAISVNNSDLSQAQDDEEAEGDENDDDTVAQMNDLDQSFEEENRSVAGGDLLDSMDDLSISRQSPLSSSNTSRTMSDVDLAVVNDQEESLGSQNLNDQNEDENVTVAIKSTKEKTSRIGSLSSRFSTGIRRLKSARSQAQQGKDDERVSDAQLPPNSNSSTSSDASSTAPSGRLGMFKKTGSFGLGSKSRSDSSDNIKVPSAPTSSGNTVSSKRPSAGGSSSTSRILRGLSTTGSGKNDHWKTLSACYRTKAYLVLPSGLIVYGILRIGATTLVFEGERVTTIKVIAEEKDASVHIDRKHLASAYVSELKRRVWGVRVIRVIHRRRFLMDGQSGLEIYFVDGSSCLFGFEGEKEPDLVYATLKERKPPCLAKWGKRLLTSERMFSKSKWTDMWLRREISNFEYLMLLNVSASRSYNDITQYPIFPWVIKNFEALDISLDDPAIYRDFTKPIGAQTRQTIQFSKEKYKQTSESQGSNKLPAYHFSHSYSHMHSVLYFLLRLAPFTNAAMAMSMSEQQGKARWFESVQDAYQHCTTATNGSSNSFYELPPEFFYLPDFLVGKGNRLFTAAKKNQPMGTNPIPRKNVTLPNWASSPYDFIRRHRQALESDYVSANLHHWIDLIFGYKQRDEHAVDAHNVYHIACYPDILDLSTLKANDRAKLTQRGTIPIQLFQKPHPKRMSQDEALEARFPASHNIATLSNRRQVRRHDLGSKHATSVSSIRFSSATPSSGLGSVVGVGVSTSLGSGSGMGAHSSNPDQLTSVVYTCDESGLVLAKKYLNGVPDQTRSCPFTLNSVDQWWKLPSGSLVSDGVVFYELMISSGYWDGSWRIHWSVDGELLQRIAFHKKPISCMARSEDDFTGDLALAFGSEDCTVSVWAISKLAATRRRVSFGGGKKELPVGNMPWVLLNGHTSPVVAVALNVDMDVVVSSSRDNAILLHSLRSAMPLHNIAIDSPTNSVVMQLCISSQGDTLIHSIIKNDQKKQSDLYLVSINGYLVSHTRLYRKKQESEQQQEEAIETVAAVVSNDDILPLELLPSGVLFTKSGEFIVTASITAGGSMKEESVIEARPIGAMDTVVKRIDCKRPDGSVLTSVSLAPDERCVICGYSDGALIAYALHFGICDGVHVSATGVERKAREQEAEALARANKRDLLLKETGTGASSLFKRTTSNLSDQGPPSDSHGRLWLSKQDKLELPEEPSLSIMLSCYVLLKRQCTAGEIGYEELIRQLWNAVYCHDTISQPSAPLDVFNSIDASSMGHLQQQNPKQQPFERVGESWSRLGFQRPDPTTDFRAGGMLSLNCLVYFATHHYDDVKRMVENQVPGSHEHTYPWGPAGINITCMIARLFWKTDGHLCKDRHVNWQLFHNQEAFYLLFAEAFVLFDFLWTDMNAQYSSFSVVMQATTERVIQVLEDCMGNLHQFKREMRSHIMTHSERLSSDARDVLSSSTTASSSAMYLPPEIVAPTTSTSSTSTATTNDLLSFSPVNRSNPVPALLQVDPFSLGSNSVTNTPDLLDFSSNSSSLTQPPPPAPRQPSSMATIVDPFPMAPAQAAPIPASTPLVNLSMGSFQPQQTLRQQQQQQQQLDPFAGNNLIGIGTGGLESTLSSQNPPASSQNDEEQDPFACLLK